MKLLWDRHQKWCVVHKDTETRRTNTKHQIACKHNTTVQYCVQCCVMLFEPPSSSSSSSFASFFIYSFSIFIHFFFFFFFGLSIHLLVYFLRVHQICCCVFFACVTCFLCYALISGPTANQQSNIISLTKQLCNIHAQPCTQSQRIINVQFPYCHST